MDNGRLVPHDELYAITKAIQDILDGAIPPQHVNVTLKAIKNTIEKYTVDRDSINNIKRILYLSMQKTKVLEPIKSQLLYELYQELKTDRIAKEIAYDKYQKLMEMPEEQLKKAFSKRQQKEMELKNADDIYSNL
jgi:hypothetical protein